MNSTVVWNRTSGTKPWTDVLARLPFLVATGRIGARVHGLQIFFVHLSQVQLARLCPVQTLWIKCKSTSVMLQFEMSDALQLLAPDRSMWTGFNWKLSRNGVYALYRAVKECRRRQGLVNHLIIRAKTVSPNSLAPKMFRYRWSGRLNLICSASGSVLTVTTCSLVRPATTRIHGGNG
jgi:hypothetical protein